MIKYKSSFTSTKLRPQTVDLVSEPRPLCRPTYFNKYTVIHAVSNLHHYDNFQPFSLQARVDRLTFLPGQRYAYIDVTIRDNSVPENVKSFDVELVNPGGGAAVHPDRGSRIRVEIQHSDQAYGVFQFDDASLRVLTSEHSPDGIGDNDVNLRVNKNQ